MFKIISKTKCHSSIQNKKFELLSSADKHNPIHRHIVDLILCEENKKIKKTIRDKNLIEIVKDLINYTGNEQFDLVNRMFLYSPNSVHADIRQALLSAVNLNRFAGSGNEDGVLPLLQYMFSAMDESLKDKKLKELNNDLSPLAVALANKNFKLANFFLDEARNSKIELLMQTCEWGLSILLHVLWDDSLTERSSTNNYYSSKIYEDITDAIRAAELIFQHLPPASKAELLLKTTNYNKQTILHHVAQWCYCEDKIIELINVLLNAFMESGRPLTDFLSVVDREGHLAHECAETEAFREYLLQVEEGVKNAAKRQMDVEEQNEPSAKRQKN